MPLFSRRPGEAPGARFGDRRSAKFSNEYENTFGGHREGYDQEAYPELRVGSEGTTPDDIRVNHRDPPLNDPNDPRYSHRVWDDKNTRYQKQVFQDPMPVRQYKTPPGQNPMWDQERLPIRPSAKLNPLTNAGHGTTPQFNREWHIPRQAWEIFGGAHDPQDENDPAMRHYHFSMATHRRRQVIYGLNPQGKLGVNTTRNELRAWDEHLTNTPGRPSVATRLSSIAGNRSFRNDSIW